MIRVRPLRARIWGIYAGSAANSTLQLAIWQGENSVRNGGVPDSPPKASGDAAATDPSAAEKLRKAQMLCKHSRARSQCNILGGDSGIIFKH